MVRSTISNTFAPAYQPQYDHTQHGPLVWLILAPATVILLVVALNTNDPTELMIIRVGGGVMAAFALSFTWLRIFDAGESLVAQFGPLPVFGKRIRYADITAAEPDRSSVIDGWGIHWVPFRGWTFNLWGFDCVRLTLANGRTVRLGTDDPAGLAEFLRQKCCATE